MTRLTVVLLFLSVYAPSLRGQAPDISVDYGDNPEMVASALTLANAHPPGYPLHVLLGRLAAALPAGSPAFRVGLIATATGALAALAAGWSASLLAAAAGAPATAAAVVAALAWGFAPAAWWLTAIGEKYALFLALAGAAVVALWRHARTGSPRALLGSALATGLAMDAHAMGACLVPVLALAAARAPSRARTAGLAAVAALLALGVKPAYAAIRAAAGPLVNWETPSTAGSLLSYLLIFRYGFRFFGPGEAGDVAGRVLSHVLRFPWHELGIVLAVALPGAVLLRRVSPPAAGGAALLAASSVGIAAVYKMPFISVYYLPLIWLLAVLAGAGAAWTATRWRAAVLVFAAAIAWHARGAAVQADRSRSYLAPDHLRNMEAALPTGAVLLAKFNLWLFPAWAGRAAGTGRADLNIVNNDGMAYDDRSERRRLERSLGLAPGDLDRFQEGPPLFWEIARRLRPAPVFYTMDELTLGSPSRGARWHGVLLRAGRPEEPLAVDAAASRAMRAWRWRDLVRQPSLASYVPSRHGDLDAPQGFADANLANYYARALAHQGSLALEEGRHAAAAALAAKGMRVAPELPELHDLAARAALAAGDAARARGAWLRALDLTGGMYVEPHAGLAELAEAEGKSAEARDHWRAAATLGAGRSHALVAEGDAAVAMHWPDRALAAWRRAAAVGFVARGAAHYRAGNVHLAALVWRRALALDPANVQALQGQAGVAMLEERFEDAVRLYTEGLRVEAGSGDLREGWSKAREAIVARGRLPRLERAAASGTPDALCDLGNAWFGVGRPKVAEALYRRALEREPASARAWSNLGSALVSAGRFADAIAAYLAALRAQPDYAEAMVNLGATYDGLGRREEAIAWLRKAVVARPGDARAREMLARLTPRG